MSKPSHKNILNIGIAGLGTVGVGTFDIITGKQKLLNARTGKSIAITAVSARDKTKDRGLKLDGITWHDDAVDLAGDDNVDVVVELIGGADGVAYELCKTALENGKSVVTANKALIATHGTELAEIAEKTNATLSFEAAVAGGIPVIKSIKEGLAANCFSRVVGILNGTCNYILTAMEKDGRDFDDVLKEAQELGYAEADPTFDIDGIDTAHKLAILTSLSFGSVINSDNMYVEGIRAITLDDITHAGELGYKIRLLGIADKVKTNIAQHVYPCLVPEHSPLANVDGVLNAVMTECDSLGPLFMEGAGAGAGPTASAVVADIIDIARGNNSPALGVPVAELTEYSFTHMYEHKGSYYIRIMVKDKPGVLAAITAALSEENIGLDSVLQKEHREKGTANIVITTFEASEKDVKKVLHEIAKIEYVLKAPHVIRIEEG